MNFNEVTEWEEKRDHGLSWGMGRESCQKKTKPSDKGIHRSKKVYLSFYNDSLVCKIKINCVTLEVVFQIWLICIGILMC